jgi:hypothetical protein
LVTYFNEANSYGWQPMRSIDTNVDRLYAVNVRYTTALQVYCFQNLGGSPSMVKLTEPPGPAAKVLFVPEMIAPQAASSPGNRFIDSLDSRLSFCWYVDDKLLVAHSTRVSAADFRSQLRWYEINLNQWPVGSTTPSIGQRGSLTGGSGMAYYVPALASNRDGDMAMLFTRSSPSIVADLMTAYRRPSDPANSFGSPSVAFSSEGGWYGSKFNASDPARWGDYFGLSIDPVDRTSFWACGMIGAATQAEPYRWKTRIFRFNTRPTVTKTYAVRLINRIFGGTPTGNLRSAQTADNQYFSIPAGGTPTRAVARYTIRIPGDRTRIQRLNYVIEYAGINGGQITVRMLNRRTGLYEQIGTAPMNATDLRRGFSIERHFADYYDALGDVVFEVTATGPSPFLYKTDFTALQVISV